MLWCWCQSLVECEKEEVPIYKKLTQSSEELYMYQRYLKWAFDSLWFSRRISWKATCKEKPYHWLEKCAQNDVDWLGVSCGFWPCEDCPAEGEEFDVGFEEPCQRPELVSCWGCMEGVLEVCDHKLLHMESFKMQYGRKYYTTIQWEGTTLPTDVVLQRWNNEDKFPNICWWL